MRINNLKKNININLIIKQLLNMFEPLSTKKTSFNFSTI